MRSPRRSRLLWLVGATTAVAGLGGAAALSSSGSDKDPSNTARVTAGGRRAAAFELPDLREGAPAVSLAALSGKPVVLNFFAAWCAPCVKELPAFQAVAEQIKGVAFIGIDHQDSRRAAQELLEDTGVEFPAGYDPEGNVARAYGLRGMPTTVFISAGGRILERRTGEMSGSELRQAISRHFGPATRAS